MKQQLFFIFVLLLYTIQSFCQDDKDITRKDCAKFWLDKNDKPLINPNSFSNAGGNTQNNSLPDRGLFATKEVAGGDKPKELNEDLHDFEYNVIRQFDVLKYMDEKYPNHTKQKQGFSVSFHLPEEYRDILPKKLDKSATSGLSFKFILDQSKQQYCRAIEVRFTYEKEILRLHIDRIDVDGTNISLHDSKAEDIEDKLNIKWPENTSRLPIDFSLNLDSTNFDFLINDVSIPLQKEKPFKRSVNTKCTSINKIIATSEGLKKSTVGPIKEWYVFDESLYRPLTRKNQRRKAIIIANNYNDHKYISPLEEYPINDARGVFKKLDLDPKLWERDTLFNLSEQQLRNKIRNSAYLEGYDTLFIYYAGHGVSYLDQSDKDAKVWKDYWVPNDFDDSLSSESLQNKDLKFYNETFYGVHELLEDLRYNYENIYFNNRERIEKTVKVMIISDACRENFSHRGLINLERNSRDALNVPFEYFFFPAVPEGGRAANKKSWTQKYFINNEELQNTPIESLPKVGENYPTVLHMIKSKGKESDEIYQNPFTKIFLMKNY
jgi:hypothetical protein